MAVVEGVGDFACEYMTNGAILNLGRTGKGFGNGMSGGNAYQYDPEGQFEAHCDTASVIIGRLDDGSEAASAHEPIIHSMLQRHAECTGSGKAGALLADWHSERCHFKYTEPLWLYETQDLDYLRRNTERKAMIEELASWIADTGLEQMRRAYLQDAPLFGGATPGKGEGDGPLTFQLINSYRLLANAARIARTRASGTVRTARALILSRNKSLADTLVREAREALGNCSDAHLTAQLAHKRLADYKAALIQRDVQDINAPGTSAWIIRQERKNRKALAAMLDIDELLAIHATHCLAASMQGLEAA
jgi:glutamate synthase (NADPH/NADH) large chain